MRLFVISLLAAAMLIVAACSSGHGRRPPVASTTTRPATSSTPSTADVQAGSSTTAGTASGPTTNAGFVAQGDAICAEELRKLEGVPPSDLPQYLPQGLAALEAERGSLGRITPPPPFRAAYAMYLAKLDLTIQQVRLAVAKLPDQAAAKSAFSAAAAPAKDARTIAGNMGFIVCGDKPRQIPITSTSRPG